MREQQRLQGYPRQLALCHERQTRCPCFRTARTGKQHVCLSASLSVHASAVAADITTGLNGKSLTISLGTPDNLVLRGNAFPVIVAQDGINTMVAAARVSAAGGKVVAFNKVSF